MNRERLKTLRDHLASLPDEQLDMTGLRQERECGTVACIAGWAIELFGSPEDKSGCCVWSASGLLGLNQIQDTALFTPGDESPERPWTKPGAYTRTDAIAAIDSMLANPDDDALPVWPEREAGR